MVNADIRAIFQDVDGCLNPEDGEAFGASVGSELSSKQIAMLCSINDAVEASPLEHFVINTGRFWLILEMLADHLPTAKLRYFVCEHGCVIYDRQLGKNLDLASMARDAGLFDLARRYENLDVMNTLLAWYDDKGAAIMEAVYGEPMSRLDKVGNLSFAIPDGADGAEVLTRVEALICADFQPADFRRLEFCRSDQFIDILPGIHKMDGIDLMLAHLSLSRTKAIAIGDYLNDLAVFEGFETVLCPKNAHPKIKQLTAKKGEHGIISECAFGAAVLNFVSNLKRF